MTEIERMQAFSYLDGAAAGLKEARNDVIKELEKIKAEIQAEQITDGQVYNGEYFSDDALNINYGISICLDILDKYISELKGENK